MSTVATVRRTENFDLDGTGASPHWQRADWLELRPCAGGPAYASRAKLLASTTGLYVLFDCQDSRLTCTALGDGDDIFNEDVFELFLWPDQSHSIYFEYEISPLGTELVLLIPNRRGAFMGWAPWHYEGDRKTRHATAVRGGAKQPGAPALGWSAEIFIPYALLVGIADVPPTPGTRWRANLCRIDYDGGQQQLYSWSPAITNSFHAIELFDSIEFEP